MAKKLESFFKGTHSKTLSFTVDWLNAHYPKNKHQIFNSNDLGTVKENPGLAETVKKRGYFKIESNSLFLSFNLPTVKVVL